MTLIEELREALIAWMNEDDGRDDLTDAESRLIDAGRAWIEAALDGDLP